MGTNTISAILGIILIILIALLMILSIIFLVLKSKENSNKDKNNKKSEQSKNNSKIKENVKTTGYNKQSIFDFMEFDSVTDNMIVQKDGKRYIMVVECQGVNYDLMSQIEKVSVEEGFQQFLNTLRHPIQIYIQTRTVNLENSVRTYKNKLKDIQDNYNRMKAQYNQMKESGSYTEIELEKYFYELTKQRNLLEYGTDIIANTEKMSLNKNVLNQKYYIVIPYFSEENSDEKYDKEEIKKILNLYMSKYYDEADDQQTWFGKMKDMAEELGYAREVKEYKKEPEKWPGHVGDISTVLRVAITRRRNTPDLYEIMHVLGKANVEKRIELITK